VSTQPIQDGFLIPTKDQVVEAAAKVATQKIAV
jgi:hypothetical protein